MEENKEDPMWKIIDAADAHLRAAGALNSAVRDARRGGSSWADIGKALGTSKQAAYQRFHRTTG